MPRKVFISFLGTNNYTECVYSYNSFRSPVVKFVQSALTKLCCEEWTQNDKALIFTTKEALPNWELLQKEWTLQIPCENKMIPSGKNEDEIWNIFQIMYDSLQTNDRLYVDITHSFRSIPLLASSLLQYAKFLKNISVHAIYYGAFETLGNPRDIPERIPDPNKRIAPVFDLTAFSEIQDWSAAANDFIRFGNPARLSQLTKEDVYSVLRETKGKDKVASTLRDLNNYVDELSLNIRTNRGKKIIEGKAPSEIIRILGSLEQDLIKPLNPILEDIKKSVEKIYKGKNNTENMLSAVEWCIDKQLIQEGFTILQEGIISYLSEDYHDKNKRLFISGFLNKYGNGFDRTKFDLSYEKAIELEESLNNVPKIREWSSLFQNITDIRNDINHAGMNKNSRKAVDFEGRLNELYKQIKTLI